MAQTQLPEIPELIFKSFEISEPALNYTHPDNVQEQGPAYFGEFVDFQEKLDFSLGKWTPLDNGSFGIAFEFNTSNAKSLNLLLSEVNLSEGDIVYTYNPDAPEYFLSYKKIHVSKTKQLTTFPIKGNRLRVLMISENPENNGFVLKRVVYGTKENNGFGSSGSCNVNANCPAANGLRDQQKATSIILVGGNGHCTGTLVNNTTFDGTPYIIGAAHCLPANHANVGSWAFGFGFESVDCTNKNATPVTFTGAELKAEDTYFDAALLLMDTKPVDDNLEFFYDGWSKAQANPASGSVFHHPSGDIKKFSKDNGGIIKDFYLDDPNDFKAWKVKWDMGTTEGGSSGSSLLNEHKQIIGTLTGGRAACGSPGEFDYYAPINDFFEYDPKDSAKSYAPWLDPGYSKVDTIPGYSPKAVKPNFDLSIARVTGVPRDVCNQNFVPVIKVYNGGKNTVNSYVITLSDAVLGQLDQKTVNTPLTPGQSTEITMNGMELTTDINLRVDLTVANDSRPFNNLAIIPIANQNGIGYNLEIRLDDWGSENTWELIDDETGSTILSGGPYLNGIDGTIENILFCLVDQKCYTFKFTDSQGDGICCDYGNGYYKISHHDGTVVASGWNTSPPDQPSPVTETSKFCAKTTGIAEYKGIKNLEVFPNPLKGDGTLSIGIADSELNGADFRVVNRIGKVVQEGVVLNKQIALKGLNQGAYILLIQTKSNNYSSKLVID